MNVLDSCKLCVVHFKNDMITPDYETLVAIGAFSDLLKLAYDAWIDSRGADFVVIYTGDEHQIAQLGAVNSPTLERLAHARKDARLPRRTAPMASDSSPGSICSPTNPDSPSSSGEPPSQSSLPPSGLSGEAPASMLPSPRNKSPLSVESFETRGNWGDSFDDFN